MESLHRSLKSPIIGSLTTTIKPAPHKSMKITELSRLCCWNQLNTVILSSLLWCGLNTMMSYPHHLTVCFLSSIALLSMIHQLQAIIQLTRCSAVVPAAFLGGHARRKTGGWRAYGGSWVLLSAAIPACKLESFLVTYGFLNYVQKCAISETHAAVSDKTRGILSAVTNNIWCRCGVVKEASRLRNLLRTYLLRNRQVPAAPHWICACCLWCLWHPSTSKMQSETADFDSGAATWRTRRNIDSVLLYAPYKIKTWRHPQKRKYKTIALLSEEDWSSHDRR